MNQKPRFLAHKKDLENPHSIFQFTISQNLPLIIRFLILKGHFPGILTLLLVNRGFLKLFLLHSQR